MASVSLPHLTFSLGVHALAVLLALSLARGGRSGAFARPLSPPIEVELVPEAPSLGALAAPAVPSVLVARPPLRLSARARALRGAHADAYTEPNETILPAPAAPPEGIASQPSVLRPSLATERVTAADILRQSDALVVSLAAAAPAPGASRVGRGSARDIFGPGPRPSLGEIAGAPTRELLAGGEHIQPAGTMRYDRELARRAEEFFMPVRSIPGLGAAVQRAALTGLGAIERRPSAGELAVGSELDAAHAQSYTTVQMPPATPPRYHLVRAEVEVVQTSDGGVRSAEVVRPSGVRGFDERALQAIRDAVPEVGAMAVRALRRTRWAFEVSNAQSAGSTLIGGGNEGWTPLREQSDGVWLRMRVRRLSVTLLPGG